MTVQQYVLKLDTLFITGNAREHSYRGDLQNLLMAILPDILVTNEPARVSCGAPDYVLTRKNVPVGYIEAKDIGVDLNSKTLKEQFERYKSGLSNLIFTDYLDFHFYKDGVLYTKIAIAAIENGHIVGIPEQYEQFIELVKNFSRTVSQTIKSPTKLAVMMAGKAKLMADVIQKSLNSDDAAQERSNLKSQMLSFQQMLIHDIDNAAFADIYAQTIAYGMFAARYHDPSLPTFSRQEAATLIPKSNPFLRRLFQDIAGYDLDDRLMWIVDELVQIFLATDVADIMRNFGKSTKQEDPVVHFYETFLANYNPALRKARGVWYTPQPVVNFIVRAVDDILKTEFNLKDGLADTSKIKIKKREMTKATADRRSKLAEVEVEHEVHKVQILDPATGTGTFLAEVVRHIHKKFASNQGIWSRYVAKDLIPRLNGFELLMASYAMAHLKMDMLFTETGYKPTDEQRFRIFLTNSLEEAHPDTGTLFSSWLSDEADQANAIKRDAPVMVVIGNPPYSVSSSNKSDWIQNLTKDYKKNLNERKINLDDDYIKFIRFGQHFIDKNGEGVLAYISNNSFIDGITHRQMRKSLLESFDKIYILDLHGNARIKECSPDGSLDQNVFDIMQGVSINIFVKKRHRDNALACVYHSEVFGKREDKYRFLETNIVDINWKNIKYNEPYNFFVPKNFDVHEVYNSGFKLNELFTLNSNGLETHKDDLTIRLDKDDLQSTIKDFITLTEREIKIKYAIDREGSEWQVAYAKKDAEKYPNNITSVTYRPFDSRFTLFTPNSKGFLARPRYNVLKHLKKPNVALLIKRQCKQNFSYSFIVNDICEACVFESAFAKNQVLPLYIYADDSDQHLFHVNNSTERKPNLDSLVVKQIAYGLGMEFVAEKPQPQPLSKGEGGELPVHSRSFAPIDLLDYIYAVLHSPSYREKYKEFLKIDFPRVPYPTDVESFWKLVALGGELRGLHLLESERVGEHITSYPVDGDNVVGKIRFEAGRVYINETQYFDGVPEEAWNFYIGGYQPCQKWLKDRKGRVLSWEDVLHWQGVVVALWESGRIMNEVDTITFNHE